MASCWIGDVKGKERRWNLYYNDESSRVEPLNRSSRHEEAPTSFSRKGMSLLTSAATRSTIPESRIGTMNGGARLRRALILSTRDQGSTESRPTWFMESLLSFFRMHWDHEPWRSGVSVERRNSWEQQSAALYRDAATGRRFMEREWLRLQLRRVDPRHSGVIFFRTKFVPRAFNS